jgi:hypothetical protein
MQLYDTIIDEITTFQAQKAAAGELKELVFSKNRKIHPSLSASWRLQLSRKNYLIKGSSGNDIRRM